MPDPERPTAKAFAGLFATTHWSLVAAAKEGDTPRSREALAKLCQDYWYPVYAYVRRKGYDEHEASDLAQGFFCHLLERRFPRAADRRRGKFRSFLLGCLEYFLAKEWTRARRLKRGGGVRIQPLENGTGEALYRAEADADLDPAKDFERRWASTVVEAGLTALRGEYASDGKAELFDALRPSIAGEGEPYAALSARLDMSAGAVRVAVHRLRKRFAVHLREVIAQTVATSEDVEDEIRSLLAALG